MQFMTISYKPLPDYKSKEHTYSSLIGCCLVWVLKSKTPTHPSLNKHYFLQSKSMLTRAILKASEPQQHIWKIHTWNTLSINEEHLFGGKRLVKTKHFRSISEK